MALAFSSLFSEEDTSGDGVQVSTSQSPPTDAVLLLSVAVSDPSTIPDSSDPTVAITDTFTGVTWTMKEWSIYGGRRHVRTFIGAKSGAWGSGTVTMTWTASGTTIQNTAMVLDQCTGADTTTPSDAAVASEGANNLTLADVGVVGAGDAVYVIGAHEDGTNNFDCTGYTGITTLGSMANVRQIRTFYDDTTPDETPNLTSDGGGNAVGGIAFIINDGGVGGGVLGGIAGEGGLAGTGGIAGPHGGIAG